MEMRIDLIWLDDGSVEYRASCGRCRYSSPPLEEEEAARAAWFGHVCVRQRVGAESSA